MRRLRWANRGRRDRLRNGSAPPAGSFLADGSVATEEQAPIKKDAANDQPAAGSARIGHTSCSPGNPYDALETADMEEQLVGDAASGASYDLEAGPYRASVVQVGGGLRSLTFGERDLVRGYRDDERRPLYRGAVLAPWPNRIADGRYRYAGTEHQLPLTEPVRGNALHGLTAWLPWTVLVRSASTVQLGCRIWPQDGYPFMIDLQADYALDHTGLQWSLTAVNRGDEPAPYGCSIHPYLVAGPGRVDDWSLELNAGQFLDVDDDRLLPRGLQSVEGTDFDFRGGRPLKGVKVDHALTSIASGDRGGMATVRCANGGGVRMRWDRTCPWVQVHTADRPEPHYDRLGVAVEPMTCPPNAFQTAQDVVSLLPGARHTARWRIEAVLL